MSYEELLFRVVSPDSIRAHDFQDTSRTRRMPLLTVRAIESHRPKVEPYKVSLDRGLQLRVAPDGVRTLLVRYTVKGGGGQRQYRLPQEYGEGEGQIKLAAACAEAARIRALAREGIDWPAQEEARIRTAFAEAESAQRFEGLTLAQAVREYVDKKRRAKDGLPLKARTRADYLAMIEPGRTARSGKRFADGELYQLAQKVLTAITGNDIRDLYAALLQRSERQATYAMQVVRAVMRWHGVVVADNPLARDTPGRDRIIIATGVGDPAPIPPEKLGEWWRAAAAAPSPIAADYYRFQLLTGCRGIEIHGHKRHGYPPIKVADLDVAGGKITLRDTKNRRDHKLLLSRQALDIAVRNAAGKKPDVSLFAIVDARKTLAWINAKAGTTVQGHGLRDTFASIAEELVSGAALKKMMNHAAGGDVTLGSYVGKSEAQLRHAWQTVADFIDAAAGRIAANAAQPRPRSRVGARRPWLSNHRDQDFGEKMSERKLVRPSRS
jgi:Arm DNA-binding domain